MNKNDSEMPVASVRRCLILGARGFIGTHLVEALVRAGSFVRCFDQPRGGSLSRRYSGGASVEHFEGDFLHDSDLISALEDIDVCFHLISTTLPKSSNADPVFDVESNVLGTVKLLNLAIKSGVKKVVFVSSGGTVYGVPQAVPIAETHPTDPVCSYGVSKLAIEKYLAFFNKQHGLDYSVLRLANPFGEGQRTESSQGIIAVFLGKILRGEPVEVWGDGSVVRDYIYIDDVVDALLLSSELGQGEHVFNIGSGRGRSVNEVLDSLERATGLIADRRYLPPRSFDVPVSVLRIDRAFASLGWAPTVDFDEGLQRFSSWMKQQFKERLRA
ncbi:NAD-dependent epimerase/dehydratase family protein [Trinickia soli]|uniref:NAD-dependent epimerase/dehydratase family protein n=1 Tax=Trinickia soli TaxID=380675 RepID=UPI001254D38A|nr:NAD-dependent epimerase/dehydratase family protein [Paraburkholderia sp. T12-10]